MECAERKRTAPIPSVAADGEQPNPQGDISTITHKLIEVKPTMEESPKVTMEESPKVIPINIQQNSDKKFLQTISMNELYQTTYPNIPPIIDGLLYPGIYLFVGAPKVGKSFMMAQIAYHVSMGLPLWGYGVHKGTVLYLALEDDARRLQKRLYRMFGVESTGDLFLAFEAGRFGEGLEESLNRFLDEHSDTKLIIIDTFQKIRGNAGDKYSYADDYDVIAKLKRLANSHNICLLLVHHTRKQQADDMFDMISGSNGLLGAADGAFLLYKRERTADKAILDVVGRDQPELRAHLTKNEERLIWDLERIETKIFPEPSEPLLDSIAALVNKDRPLWEGTATELTNALGLDISPNALSMKLNIQAGELEEKYHICYKKRRNHAGRTICLTMKESQT